MRKNILAVLANSFLLLAISVAILYVTINYFSSLVEAYYNPIYYPGAERSNLFFLHPLIISIAFLFVWHRIKSSLRGNVFLKGVEFGIFYSLIATLPSMWITFSSMNVSVSMVLLWWSYGFFQATLSGWLFAWLRM